MTNMQIPDNVRTYDKEIDESGHYKAYNSEQFYDNNTAHHEEYQDQDRDLPLVLSPVLQL